MPISVSCACGVRLKTKDENAGRSLPCPKCGQKIRVPAAGAAAPRPSAPPKAEAAEPVPADLYGLDDAPAPRPARPAGDDDTFADRGGRGGGSGEEKPLQRAGYTPMTEAKKKKIAKRAAKVDKSKPSYAGAGVGVSLGTVLAIALVGWRIYRVTHRVGRAIHQVNASAREDPSDAENAKEMNREIEEMVKQPGTAEAREWLDASKHPNHAVFEMGNDRARAMVEGFYARGAEGVYVLDPSKLGDAVVTAMIAVKLPADPAKRKECLAWEVQYLEGEDPTQDTGQNYLLITTD